MKYKVLCIGVNQVPGLKKLSYAEKDAKTAAAYFSTLKDKSDVTLLTGKNATRENIIPWLTRCNAVEEELNVIIFFAGHGSAEKEEKTNTLSRCLWIDSRTNKGINKADHKIKTAEILSLLDNSAHRLIFIIDACYDFGQKEIAPIKDIFKKFKESERMTSLKRYTLISASAVNNYAFEDHQLKHGVLAYYFLRVISGRYTFFLRKKITFFKFLAILDKQVRNHRFLTDTGRKLPLKVLLENGIMVHCSDINFELPVLEPWPFISDREEYSIKWQFARTIYTWTCTRLRLKLCRLTHRLVGLLMIFFLVNIFVVHIKFDLRRETSFHDFLLGRPAFTLDKLSGPHLKNYGPYKRKISNTNTFNIYLFKHNWVSALLAKLDEEGKIVLSGNLLGLPISDVEERRKMDFVCRYPKDVFYWDNSDARNLLNYISRQYHHFDIKRRGNALILLAAFGKEGKELARKLFDFHGQPDQRIRDLFLEYFYSIDFWQQHIEDFRPDDYLYLLKEEKQLPPPRFRVIDQKTRTYLQKVVQLLPKSPRDLEMANLESLYNKLMLLAFFGNRHFPEKASLIFQHVFDLDRFVNLSMVCRDFFHKMWLLDQFLERAPDFDFPNYFWPKFLHTFIKQLPAGEKSRLLRHLIDSSFLLVPEQYHHDLLDILTEKEVGVIALKEWEKWIKKYPIDPYYVVRSASRINSPVLFDFIEKHQDYFYGDFSRKLFDVLYEMAPSRTIQLVKTLYKLSPKDRFRCAVFLVDKKNQGYEAYIVKSLKQSNPGLRNDIWIYSYYGTLNQTLIRMTEKNRQWKNELRGLLNDSILFYGFYPFLYRWWPVETEEILLEPMSQTRDRRGLILRRFCEGLPDELRKKFLTKICSQANDEFFKSRIEDLFAAYYPEEFLKLIYSGGYVWHRFTEKHVTKAFQSFSYKTLVQELSFQFRQGSYWNLRYLCDALVEKEANKELQIDDLRKVLKQFNRPEERVLLKDLRHYVNSRLFNRRDQALALRNKK